MRAVRRGAARGPVPRIEVAGTIPRSLGISVAELKRAAAHFAERSRARVGRPAWNEVTVVLVRDAESDAAHRAVMGVAGATDVITQAYDSIPPEPQGLCGELIVNTDQALRAAPKRRGWSAAKELLLYVAHGMDHLSGADDRSERGYRAMRRRELRWMKTCLSLFASLALAAVCRAARLEVPAGGVAFGEVASGERAERSAEVRNVSDSPVTVSLVRACCGVEASLSPMRIEPSASATLAVAVKSSFAGEFSSDVRMFCDDPSCPVVSVPVSGVVLAPAEAVAEGAGFCGRAAAAAVMAALCAGAALLFLRGRGGWTPALCLWAAARLLLCGVFLYAGAAKLCDVPAFAGLVSRYGVLPASAAGPVAAVLPVAECAAGLLLVFSRWVRASAAAVAAMLVVFIAVLAQAAVRGLDVSCGCFGGAASSGLVPAIARDAALLVPAVWLALGRGVRS